MIETILIQNKSTNENLIMDKFTTQDYILDYVDWGQASVNQTTSQYINQIGVSVIKTSYKSRPIEISGYIVANSEQEMTERKRFLNNFVNPTSEYNAIYKDYKISFRPTFSIRYTNTEEKGNNEVVCRFKISGICPYPLFSLAAEEVDVKVGKFIQMFHFPFHTTETEKVIFAVKSEGEYRQRIIRNQGSIPIGFKFIFKAKGTVENPTLYNFTTNEHFTITKELVEGEIVEVNTSVGYKTVMGGMGTADTNYFQYMALDSDWLVLNVGDNIIGYSADAGVDNLDIDLQLPFRFLEVQECF